MDEELREQDEPCCDKQPCCEGPRPADGLLTSVNTSGDGLMFNDGLGVASSGTYNITIGNDADPKPSKMKDVVIKQMDYGYLVKIGCQTMCIETPKKLLKALKKYMKNPDVVENQHMSGEFMESLD